MTIGSHCLLRSELYLEICYKIRLTDIAPEKEICLCEIHQRCTVMFKSCGLCVSKNYGKTSNVILATKGPMVVSESLRILVVIFTMLVNLVLIFLLTKGRPAFSASQVTRLFLEQFKLR